jgi:hypothetical protein
MSRLIDSWYSFLTVLNPIFQLICFYFIKSHRYIYLLRWFPLLVFPGILRSFTKIFRLVIDEIYIKFKARGLKGLGIALAKSVLVLNQLGSYCFIRFPKSLIGSVLGPLGIIDGIKQRIWPYINP